MTKMAELVMMKGLPLSGKTEWAMKWADESVSRVRVSWTDILKSMSRCNRRDVRPVAVEAALRMVTACLRMGYDVVVDEENLNPVEFGLFVGRAAMCRCKVRWVVMETTVEECKRRNALMGHPVADMEIDRKAERYADWLKRK